MTIANEDNKGFVLGALYGKREHRLSSTSLRTISRDLGFSGNGGTREPSLASNTFSLNKNANNRI